MTKSTTDIEAPELDLKQLFAQLLARKWLLLIAGLFGGLVGLAMAIIPPNQYTTRAVVQIERRNDGMSLPEELIGTLLNGGAPVQNLSFATEAHVINSRLILEPVAEDLGLLYQVTPKKLPVWGDFLVRGNVENLIPAIERSIPPSYARGGEFVRIGQIDVPPSLVGVPMVLTSLGDQTFTLQVQGQTFTGTVGAPTDLGAMGRVIVRELEAPAGREFFVTRLPTREIVARLSSGLSIRERGSTGVIDFSYTGTDRDIVVPVLNTVIRTYQENSLQQRSAEIDQSIAFISEQLPVIRNELETAQEAMSEFRRQNEFAGELSLSTQDLLARLVEFATTLETLDFEIEEVLKRVTPNHPDYQRLAEERARVQARLEEAQMSLDTIPEAEQTLALLTSNLERARNLEIQLTERIEQLRILKASAVGRVRVLEPAEVVSLTGPDRRSPILMGLLAGLAAAAAWIFTRNYFRHGIEDGSELEALGLPLFATISMVTDNSKASKNLPIAIADPSNQVVEAFRGLRTGLQFSLSSAKSKTIIITSSVAGQGKSFVSQNLAVVLASAGKKVLLVDADMRRGLLHRAFGQKPDDAGLSAALAGTISFDDVTQSTEVESLNFIHRGKRPPNPAELLESARLPEFLNWAENAYDFVIIDTPPVLAVADPIIIAQYDVITMIVARHLQTTGEEIAYMLRRLETSGIKVSGAVLNAYDQKRSKYGAYGYKYGYYYSDYNYK